MNVSIRHITLLIGILSVIVSFLFFDGGRKTYDLLLSSGFLIATVSYLIILLKKKLKNNIFWTLIVIDLFVTQRLPEPLLIRKSYSIFIIRNQSSLVKLNNLILTKSNGFLFIPTLDVDVSKDLTAAEKSVVLSMVNGTNISLI
jgi:hypothetical protein